MEGTWSDHVIDVKKRVEYVISRNVSVRDVVTRSHDGMQAIIIDSADLSAYEAEKVASTSHLQLWDYGLDSTNGLVDSIQYLKRSSKRPPGDFEMSSHDGKKQ